MKKLRWDQQQQKEAGQQIFIHFLSGNEAQLFSPDPFVEEEVGLTTLHLAPAHRMDTCVTDVEPGSAGWIYSCIGAMW